ncbi:triose-phosphate isomerase [Sphingomicrobium lutaoense]|uniref:Triosephosphate isomerase n=1 Tax=Sphingomicrobium lutaoense TaxID=515949 RepID=A0A839Z276_9SPHN|nr:triose-phosphate isomerase [Sphingomicrobium lutaoense]MBB3763853.1 triosephosphate isomerase [Sphingomicrobium lutaoense]
MARRMLVAGNWKMHGLGADLGEVTMISMAAEKNRRVDTALCMPATLLHRAAAAAPGFDIGGQDVHPEKGGAHTGEISVDMIKDAGGALTIVGHSERREACGQSDGDIAARAAAALSGGLHVILCVGESLDVREAGNAVERVTSQLKASLPADPDPNRLAIAYEPIWAIGTGKVAGPEEIGEMHSALRGALSESLGAECADKVRILYGGSVNGDNAETIFAVDNVDGALVGGASLSAAKFVPIIEAASARSV